MRLDGERARDRDALLLAAGELRRQMVGAVARGRPRRGAPRRAGAARRSESPVGASFACDVLERGQRRDQVELLEDESERTQPELGKLAVGQLGEVASLEETRVRWRAGRARRGAGAASSCRSRSAPRARRTRRPRSSGSTSCSALTTSCPRTKALPTSLELVLAHSTVLRASAGRRRAAASAPAAPASRPPRTARRKPPSRIETPTGADSETASRGGARGLLDTEEAAAAGRRAGAQRRPEARRCQDATATPRGTPRTPPSTPWASDSAATWRTTVPCVQPSALSVPELAHPLADGGEREQRGEQERGDGGDDRERQAKVVREVGGVDERAADRCRRPASRSRPPPAEYVFAIRCSTAATEALSSARTSTTLTRFFWPGELLELRERQVDVDALAAERRVDESDDRERRPVQVQLRPDLQRVPRRIGRGDECLATALQEPPRGHLRRGHEAHVRVARLDAADRVRLALDVGLRRVEHLLQRLARRRDRRAEPLHPLGQALANAPRPIPPPPGPAALLVAEPAAGLAPAAALPLLRPGLDAQLRRGRPGSSACSAVRRRRDRPVDIDPVAAGLDLRDDLRHLPLLVHGLEGEAGRDRGDAVEGRRSPSPAPRVNVSCVPGRKKSWTKCVPGLAELREVGDHGLVRLDDVAAAATAAERPAAARIRPAAAARHRQVGADARRAGRASRSAPRRALREARDRDHEADADGEAEQRQDRAASTADSSARR